MMKTFKQWLEDTGKVYNNTNDDLEYSGKGIGSKIVATDNANPSEMDADPDKMYGRKKKKTKKIR